MNKLQREVLMLYSYDDDPDNVGVLETLDKGIDLIAKIPVIVSYTYQSKVHHFDKGSMIIIIRIMIILLLNRFYIY